MQNRYVGDIGDFAKYSLINALTYDEPLGIAWYLFPDENHNFDGKHVAYLDKPEIWRDKDPKVFDALKNIVSDRKRHTSEIIRRGVLNANYVSNELLETSFSHYLKRAEWRKSWFERTKKKMRGAKVIFADPDNGLCQTENFKYHNVKNWKRLPLIEAQQLSTERTAIIYHHNSRFKGGHVQEIQFWLSQLPENSFAIRYRAYSARTFFVLNPKTSHRDRAQNWILRFGDKADIHQL